MAFHISCALDRGLLVPPSDPLPRQVIDDDSDGVHDRDFNHEHLRIYCPEHEAAARRASKPNSKSMTDLPPIRKAYRRAPPMKIKRPNTDAKSSAAPTSAPPRESASADEQSVTCSDNSITTLNGDEGKRSYSAMRNSAGPSVSEESSENNRKRMLIEDPVAEPLRVRMGNQHEYDRVIEFINKYEQIHAGPSGLVIDFS